MAGPPPYLPVPVTPAGMDEKMWAKFAADLAQDGGQLVSDYLRNPGTGIPGPGSGMGNASRYNTLVAFIQDLYGVDRRSAEATAYLMAMDVDPMLSSALDLNADQSKDLAQASSQALANYGVQNGLPIVTQSGAWQGAMANGITNLTADWRSLEAGMLGDVASAIQQGFASGLGPDEVGRKVGRSLLQAGQGGYARGLLIARTQMADMQTNARLADIRANPDVFTGWWWRARPDGCPICQIQHGRRFGEGQDMFAHHMCRCVSVPVVAGSPEHKVKGGDYIPGQQRPTSDILDPPPPSERHARRGQHQQQGIPQSWRKDMPDDPRKLLTLRENGEWRESWALRKPNPDDKKPPVLPPAKPKPVVAPPKPKGPKPANKTTEASIKANRDYFKANEFGTRKITAAEKKRMAEQVKALEDKARQHDAMGRGSLAYKARYEAGGLKRKMAGTDPIKTAQQRADDLTRLKTTGKMLHDEWADEVQRRLDVGESNLRTIRRDAYRTVMDKYGGRVGADTIPDLEPWSEAMRKDHIKRIGGTPKDLTAKESALVKEGLGEYPKGWGEHVRRAAKNAKWARTSRGYNSAGRRISISGQGDIPIREVGAHEVGHTLETTRRNLRDSEQAFWESRAGTTWTKERDEGWVPVKPTNSTHDWYTLKMYDRDVGTTTHFEVFTTGIQDLLTGGVTYLDDDFRHYLWGVLTCL